MTGPSFWDELKVFLILLIVFGGGIVLANFVINQP